MNKKVFAIFSVLIVLGLQFSGVKAAGNQPKPSQTVKSFLAAEDEAFEQDVYNAGEDFYIWTTSITKVA